MVGAAVTFGLESANVVGYQNFSTVSGFNFVAPTFRNIDAKQVDIQEITLSGEGVSDLGDTIQVLDAGGASIEVYFWMSGMGWINESMEVVSKPIVSGQSVLIDTINSGLNITVAGQVENEDILTTSVSGFNFVGNSTPADLDIQKITLEGDKISDLGDTIQILDAGGAAVEVYFWMSGMGWINESMEVVTRNIPAGTGVLIDTVNAGVTIKVPSAL